MQGLCADCGIGPAVVGFGSPSRWICLACLRVALQAARQVIDVAVATFTTEPELDTSHYTHAEIASDKRA